jgi:hypothetical protein
MNPHTCACCSEHGGGESAEDADGDGYLGDAPSSAARRARSLSGGGMSDGGLSDDGLGGLEVCVALRMPV